MNFDDIKEYLPKFLSSDSERKLFEGLKDFPNNIDSRIYTTALKSSDNLFQGDGIKDMLVINLPNNSIKNANSIIISNSCDISASNERNFESQIVYAPIFSLKKYYDALINNSSKGKIKIDAHIEAIKKQRITQIFFLPEASNTIEDSIVFLDRLNNCQLEYIKSKNIKKNRIFTLSDYGAYLFVLKLSIHFSRIQDKVDRNKGVLN